MNAAPYERITHVFELGGDLMIELNPEAVELLEWVVGDLVVWVDNNDGSYTLEKKL